MWSMLRTNRDIRFLFIAQVVSFCGDWFAYVAFVGPDPGRQRLGVAGVARLRRPDAAGLLRLADRRRRGRPLRPANDHHGRLCGPGGAPHRTAARARVARRCGSGSCASAVISALGSVRRTRRRRPAYRIWPARPGNCKQASVLFGSLWGAMLAIGAAVGGVFAAAFGRDAAFVANAVVVPAAPAVVVILDRSTDARARRRHG